MSQKQCAGPQVEEFGHAERIEIPMPGGFTYAGEAAYYRREDLVDRRKVVYGNIVAPSPNPMTEHTTPHERQQPGGAIQPETEAPDEIIPEGLQQERKNPYSPTRGRTSSPRRSQRIGSLTPSGPIDHLQAR